MHHDLTEDEAEENVTVVPGGLFKVDTYLADGPRQTRQVVYRILRVDPLASNIAGSVRHWLGTSSVDRPPGL